LAELFSGRAQEARASAIACCIRAVLALAAASIRRAHAQRDYHAGADAMLGWFYLRSVDRLNKLAISAGVVAMFVVTLGGLGLVVTARQSSSLNNLIDTVPIAWDTEHYKAWQQADPGSWPELPSGETVDPSVYLRIAWLKEGLLLVRDHPFGIGFDRNAFGHGLKANTVGRGQPQRAARHGDRPWHSGALLWLGFCDLAAIAWRRHATEIMRRSCALLLDFPCAVRTASSAITCSSSSCFSRDSRRC
jgi:hypothetical protein